MTEPETAVEIATAIRAGRLSATEATRRSLHRIAERDPEINAFTVVCAGRALAQAAEVDAGKRTGPLAGVPISIKDHVWLAGLPATNGSRALADFVPDVDCVCVARLIAAGAIVVGKTNNPEFCYRGVTANDLWGETLNPRDLSRTTGGSSGGAAASVAAGMVPLAVGTDGGGSIRIPSAFCGTYGLKPTFGLVPKLPGFRGWPTLSVTGPIAGDVADLALALSVMAGPAPEDPLSIPAPVHPDYRAAADRGSGGSGLDGLRLAWSVDLGFADVDPDVRASFEAAIAAFEAAGVPLRAAHPASVVSDPGVLWDPIALAEGWASEGPVLTDHPDLVGADAAAIVRSGQQLSAHDYLDAQHARDTFSTGWLDFLAETDVLLTPTMPVTAFRTGRLAPETLDGRPVPPTFDAWCALAVPANLAGLPAATIPIGPGRDGLPVGLQIIAGRWSDDVVLRVAAALDRVLHSH